MALAAAAPASSQDFPTIEGTHPVLVTVDDLPIPGRRLHADDAARERLTRDLLAVLAKHQIQAVGLVTWRNLGGPAGERLLDLWLQDGHELGNHSHGHPDYSRTDAEAYVADMEKGRRGPGRVPGGRGRRLRFFRFPFLREGDTPAKLARMREWLRSTGQRNLPVTIDNQDWSFEEPWVTATRAGDAARVARLARGLPARPAPGDAPLHRRRRRAVRAPHARRSCSCTRTPSGPRNGTPLHLDGRARVPLRHRRRGDGGSRVRRRPPDFVARHGGSLWDRIRHDRRRGPRPGADRGAAEAPGGATGTAATSPAFCSVYDEDALFVTADGLTRGRAAVLDRYRRRYRDQAAMGTLELEVVEVRDVWGPEVTPLGDATPGAVHGASVVARWSLRRDGAAPSQGHTLLLLQRTGDAWRIVHDASM